MAGEPLLHQILAEFSRVVGFVKKLAAFRALVARENGFDRNSREQSQYAPAGVLVFTDNERVVAVMPAGAFFQFVALCLLLHLGSLLNLRLHSKNFLWAKERLCERLRLV